MTQFYKLISRNAASEAIWVFEILYGRGVLSPPYRRSRPEIVAALCGEIDMTFDGERRRITRGEHRDVDVRRPARVFRCTVDEALFTRAALPERVTILRSELLEGALSRLVSEARLNDNAMPLALEAATLGVLAAAQRAHEAPRLDRKLLEAIRDVRDTSATLAAIAKRCGFSDQPHLTRTFRQQLGVTPAEYRRRHRFAT
jgi:AraC-like DNA-binding protein